MTNDTTYNGWTNWETWHTNLLIENTEATQKQATLLGKRCADIRAGLVKGKSYDANRAADAFHKAFSKAWTETKQFAQNNAREIGQGWAEPLGSVNWREIAESHMDNADTEAGRDAYQYSR